MDKYREEIKEKEKEFLDHSSNKSRVELNAVINRLEDVIFDLDKIAYSEWKW